VLVNDTLRKRLGDEHRGFRQILVLHADKAAGDDDRDFRPVPCDIFSVPTASSALAASKTLKPAARRTSSLYMRIIASSSTMRA
jgi:hypothetical protein